MIGSNLQKDNIFLTIFWTIIKLLNQTVILSGPKDLEERKDVGKTSYENVISTLKTKVLFCRSHIQGAVVAMGNVTNNRILILNVY